jgi:hypothetical protein
MGDIAQWTVDDFRIDPSQAQTPNPRITCTASGADAAINGAYGPPRISPNRSPAADKFFGMVKPRRTVEEQSLWSDASQVFSNTQRVDLFNDPRWESSSPLPARRTVTEDVEGSLGRTIGKAAMFWRSLLKRDVHRRR